MEGTFGPTQARAPVLIKWIVRSREGVAQRGPSRPFVIK